MAPFFRKPSRHTRQIPQYRNIVFRLDFCPTQMLRSKIGGLGGNFQKLLTSTMFIPTLLSGLVSFKGHLL